MSVTFLVLITTETREKQFVVRFRDYQHLWSEDCNSVLVLILEIDNTPRRRVLSDSPGVGQGSEDKYIGEIYALAMF